MSLAKNNQKRHCEEQSDEAISRWRLLCRFAPRNDKMWVFEWGNTLFILSVITMIMSLCIAGCSGTRQMVKKPIPQAIPAIVAQYKTIMIDPGHGGKDPGAIGRDGTEEKWVNLQVSLQLAKILSQKGYKVFLTRKTDKYIELQKRADIANQVNADLFVSIHSNSVRSRMPLGFEIYYLKDMNDDQEWIQKRTALFSSKNRSNDIKAILVDMQYQYLREKSIQLANHLQEKVCQDFQLKKRGVKPSRLHVLREAQMPAILIELGFLSNPDEESMLKDPFFHEQMAEVIAQAIVKEK